jgi:hypothetical protein
MIRHLTKALANCHRLRADETVAHVVNQPTGY